MKITEKTREIVEKEKRLLSRTTRVPYFPLVVDEARGAWVTDVEGNRFLDFLASAAVINTGHNHPKVVEAIKAQVDKFIHYTPAYMYHAPHTRLAETLVDLVPFKYEKRVAFGLSGSSSVDGAIKAAMYYTGRKRVVANLRAYHGTTIGALSVSGYNNAMREGLGPLMPDVNFVPYPDSYRVRTVDECVRYFRELLETVVPPREIAAFIYEPVQGDGGILVPDGRYFKEMAAICREHGILLIADEVQTGFGRTGKFFASEHFDVEPDLLVLGKAMASGMPLSAVVGRSEILEKWGTPAHFFNTAGNAVSCAAASATIEIIRDENLLDNANLVGNYLMEEFRALMDRFECVGDVRGLGLMIGVDIVKSRETRERDRIRTAKICWRCWEKGLILAFFSDCVLRVEPPLVLTLDEAAAAMKIIREAMEDVERGLVPDSVLEEIKGW